LELVICDLELLLLTLFFSFQLSAFRFQLSALSWRIARPSTFTDGDAICAAQTCNLAAARRPKCRPGREKIFLKRSSKILGDGALLRARLAQTGGTVGHAPEREKFFSRIAGYF